MKYLRLFILCVLGATFATCTSCHSSSSDRGHPCKMQDDEDKAEEMDDDEKDRAYHDAKRDRDSSQRGRDRQGSSSSRNY